MSRKTRTMTTLIAGLTALGLAGCVESGSVAPEDPSTSDGSTPSSTTDAGGGENPAIEIAFAHLYDTAHPFHKCGAQNLADQLAAADANITMEVFPAGQLGGEQQLIQSVQLGDIGMTTGGPSALANWYGPWGVLDAAFAVEDWDHMVRVWESDLGDELVNGLVEDGDMRPLALWYYGTRHVTSNTEVRSPDDLAGSKMRAIDTPVSIANMQALGAEAVPVAFSELYMALQQGVIDGQENPLPTIDTQKFYEVQTTLNLTGHLVQSSGLVINDDLYQSMSDEQRQVLKDAIASATASVTDCTVSTEEELIDRWESGGAFDTIVMADEIDLDAFRERAGELLPQQFAETWGEGTFEQVRELAGQ